jgi:DNA-binding transcriptional ArsR family regulator
MAKKRESLAEKLKGKKLKRVIDPALAKVFTHPLRGHVWVVLFEVGELSATEIANELGLESEDVSYHFRALARGKLIQLVRTERRRGFDEHFYSPMVPALSFDDAEWRTLPTGVRATFSSEMLSQIIESFVQAFKAGSFDARERHLSRSWLLVDERGWSEAQRVSQRTLDQYRAIHERSAKRNEGSGERLIPVSAVIAAFETAAAVSKHEAGEADVL